MEALQIRDPPQPRQPGLFDLMGPGLFPRDPAAGIEQRMAENRQRMEQQFRQNHDAIQQRFDQQFRQNNDALQQRFNENHQRLSLRMQQNHDALQQRLNQQVGQNHDVLQRLRKRDSEQTSSYTIT